MNTQLVLGYPLLVIAALEVLLGLILLRQNPRQSRVNKATAACSFAAAAWSLSSASMYLSAALGRDFLFFARLSWIGWLTVPAALQSVLYLDDERSPRARAVGWVLYPFWIVVLGLCLFTDLVVTGGFVPYPYQNAPGPVEAPLRFLGGVQVLWLIAEIVRLRSRLTGFRRSQLTWYLYGTVIFGTGGAVIGGFLQLMTGRGMEPTLSAYFSLPWVLMIFYAITRYRLFDVRLALSNTLSTAVLFALFALSQDFLFHLIEPRLGGLAAIALSLSGVALLFFATPLGSSVQTAVRRTILRDRYLYQDVLRESINAIVSILDFSELLDYLTGTIKKSLQAESVALYLRAADGRFLLRHAEGGGRSADEALDPAVVDLVAQTGHGVVREELNSILAGDELDGLNGSLSRANAEIIIPLRYKGKLDAILTLGPKGNREPFIQSDIDLLDALAGHAAVAIENARLYEEAKQAHESLQESEARFSAVVEHSIQKALSE